MPSCCASPLWPLSRLIPMYTKVIRCSATSPWSRISIMFSPLIWCQSELVWQMACQILTNKLAAKASSLFISLEAKHCISWHISWVTSMGSLLCLRTSTSTVQIDCTTKTGELAILWNDSSCTLSRWPMSPVSQCLLHSWMVNQPSP